VGLNAQQKAELCGGFGNSGHAGPKRNTQRAHAVTAEQLAAQRAVNTKAYLVTEKGIDASRIQVRTGSNARTSEITWFRQAQPSTTTCRARRCRREAVKAQPRTLRGATITRGGEKPAAAH